MRIVEKAVYYLFRKFLRGSYFQDPTLENQVAIGFFRNTDT